MIDKLLSAGLVIPVLFLLTVSVTAYLNLTDRQKQKEESSAASRRFFVLDRDGDGFISTGEATDGYRAQFDSLDLDRDGALSAHEFIGLRDSWAKYHQNERWTEIQAVREANFVKFDNNADRSVSFAEYADFQIGIFLQSMDKSGDRMISRDEYGCYWLATCE